MIASLLSLANGVTLPIYLVFFVAPALLWLLLLAALRLPSLVRMRETLTFAERCVAKALIAVTSAVMLLRVVYGALSWQQVSPLKFVGLFYPIRVANPNYGIMAGLPWFALTLLMAWQWPRIDHWLQQARHRFAARWLVAMIVLIVFAGIQGGLVKGVSGIFADHNHLMDAQYARWDSDFFREHMQRVAGTLTPEYEAPHTKTHPPLNLLLFSLVGQLGSFGMGLLELVIFASVFPLLAQVMDARSNDGNSASVMALLLVTPGLLVYGAGSDDAWYYFLWTCALVLAWHGITRKRLSMAIAVGAVIAVACNFTYSSIVLLPAVMSFTTQRPMRELPVWLREQLPFVGLLIASFVAVLALLGWLTGFNYYSATLTVMHSQQSYLFGDRLVVDLAKLGGSMGMTIFDFVIFAGPVMAGTWCLALQHRRGNLSDAMIPAIAFIVVTVYAGLAILGIGGETGRTWGGLYLFWWLGCGMWLVQRWQPDIQYRLIRFGLVYAAMLQLVTDFTW